MLPQSVGVVGLGAMGLHMAKRLARRVPSTHVFDLNAGAVAAAVEGGCTAAHDAKLWSTGWLRKPQRRLSAMRWC